MFCMAERRCARVRQIRFDGARGRLLGDGEDGGVHERALGGAPVRAGSWSSDEKCNFCLRKGLSSSKVEELMKYKPGYCTRHFLCHFCRQMETVTIPRLRGEERSARFHSIKVFFSLTALCRECAKLPAHVWVNSYTAVSGHVPST
jgi:hypothetical protein